MSNEGKKVAELKPCPFCGHTLPYIYEPVYAAGEKAVICGTGCGAEGPISPDEASAATFWNRRALLSDPASQVGRMPESAWINVEDQRPEPEVLVLCWNGKQTFVDWFGSKHPREFLITHWMPYPLPPGCTSDMHDGRRALAISPPVKCETCDGLNGWMPCPDCQPAEQTKAAQVDLSETIADRNTRETADAQIAWWEKARLSEFSDRSAVIRMSVLIAEIRRLRQSRDASQGDDRG